MARYEHLPIYKAALDLTVHLEKLVAGSRGGCESIAFGLKFALRKVIPLERNIMKSTPVSLDQPSKAAPTKKIPARHAVKQARPAKPTLWGQGVLKKIEEFRLALASEK